MKKLAIVVLMIVEIGCSFNPEDIVPADTGMKDVTSDAAQDAMDEEGNKVNFLWIQDKTRVYIRDSQKPAFEEDFVEPPPSDFFIVHFACFGWEARDGVMVIANRYQDAEILLRGFNPNEYPDTNEWEFSFELPSDPGEFDKCYVDIFTWDNIGFSGDWQAVQFQRQVSGTVPVTTENGVLWYSSTERSGQIFATIEFFPQIEDKRWVIPIVDVVKFD